MSRQHGAGIAERSRRAGFTLHENFFNNLAELLHHRLRQVVALLRLFQPLVQPGAWAEVGRAWLWNACHLLLETKLAARTCLKKIVAGEIPREKGQGPRRGRRVMI